MTEELDPGLFRKQGSVPEKREARIEQFTETFCGQTTRARKLSVVLVVWVLICWHVYLRHSFFPVSGSHPSRKPRVVDSPPDTPEISTPLAIIGPPVE